MKRFAILVALVLAAALGPTPAYAQGPEPRVGEPARRILFGFDEDLEGWVLGGIHPAYKARIVRGEGAAKEGWGAVEVRHLATEKILFGTDRFNAGPPEGIIERLAFWREKEPRADLVPIADMRGLTFWIRSEKATTLFAIVAERSGSRWVHPFGVPAGKWRRMDIPLASFTVSEDTGDEDGRLDPAEVYTINFGDLRCFALGGCEENAFSIDSLGILTDGGAAGIEAVAPPGPGEKAQGPARMRLAGKSLPSIAQAAEGVDLLVAGVEGRPGDLVLEGSIRDPRGSEIVSIRGPLSRPDDHGRIPGAFAAPSLFGLFTASLRLSSPSEPLGSLEARLAVVPPPLESGIESPFGTCVLSDFRYTEAPGEDFRLARALGIGWDRPILGWKYVEPEPGKRDWERIDRIVEERTGAGLRLAPVIAHVPSWAALDPSDPDSPPKDLAVFERFVTDLVTRYKGRIRHWTIGNEPNWSKKQMDPAAYAALLAAADRAIDAADPEAKVMLGGIAFLDLEYIEDLYEAGAGPHFDVMNIHPYCFPAPPESVEGSDLLKHSSRRGVRASFAGLPDLLDLMRRRGDGAKPVWITELSWGTGLEDPATPPQFRPFLVDEAAQARYLVRALALALSWGIEKVFVLSIPDIGEKVEMIFGHPGLVDSRGAPKRSFPALAQATRALAGASFVRRLDLGSPDSHGLVFRKGAGAGGRHVYVLWDAGARPTGRAAALTVRGGRARLLDIFGNVIEEDLRAGPVEIPLGPDPVYLEVGAAEPVGGAGG